MKCTYGEKRVEGSCENEAEFHYENRCGRKKIPAICRPCLERLRYDVSAKYWIDKGFAKPLAADKGKEDGE